MSALVGHGSLAQRLSAKDVGHICAEALARLPLDDKRVLVLIPDHTRHAPIALFFRLFGDLLYRRVRALDYLVATGTHTPMAMERLYQHVGITASEHQQSYARVRFYNHDQRDRESLVTLGDMSGEELGQLSDGLFAQAIPVTINRLALAYDHILIVSPVVPHEAMGFAGGNKYFFPGIAGPELVEQFHWLAAIITNPAINGIKDTPTRRVIDRAVRLLPTPRTCFAFAVDEQHELACLFAGPPESAWAAAADYSEQLHIRYLDRPFRRVLGLTPPIYEEVWVAGKAMYKLEPIVADGGELVIHGAHVRDVSFVHGPAIARVGYHVRDYFLGQWERFAGESKLILAHSTNVKGVGTYTHGVERPRIDVQLATAIPRATCERINLGYRAIGEIDIERWRQDDDTLVVEEAGQVLYRLKPTSQPDTENKLT